MSLFKQNFSLKKRLNEATRIMEKYPNRIPIIVEKVIKSDIPDIDKKKFLVPVDLTLGQFIYVIRKRIKLEPEQAIYLFINNSLQPASTLMSQLYKDHADSDKFLYCEICTESTYGFTS